VHYTPKKENRIHYQLPSLEYEIDEEQQVGRSGFFQGKPIQSTKAKLKHPIRINGKNMSTKILYTSLFSSI
jgi:hypothetical protein